MAVLSRGTRARLAPSSTTSPVWPGVPGDQVLGGPGRSPDLGGPGGALHRAPHRPNDQGQGAWSRMPTAAGHRGPAGVSPHGSGASRRARRWDILTLLINAGGSRITTSNCSPSAFSAARLQSIAFTNRHLLLNAIQLGVARHLLQRRAGCIHAEHF